MTGHVDVAAIVTALADQAQLVAGHAATDRRVSRVRVVKAPDDLGAVEAGDLVVSSVEALSGLGPDGGLLDRLLSAQIAAIAIRLDGEGVIPPDVSTSADRADLPILTFGRNIPLHEVSTEVLETLLDAQHHRLDRFVDVHQDYTRVVLAGGGVAEIAATLHQQLGCTVAVLDASDRLLVVVPADDPDAMTLGASLNHSSHPVQVGDVDEGRIVIARSPEKVDGDDRVALERAAQAVAMGIAQTTAVAARQERFAALSLEELISGHGGDIVEITERAASFGWDLLRPRAVLLAAIDGPVDPRTVQSALPSIAACARATLGPEAIVWARSSTIAALLTVDRQDASHRRAQAELLRRELAGRVRSVSVSIGVGRPTSSPTELPRSYVEAARAVDVGRWARGEHVVEVFDDLGLDRLLAAAPPDELDDFVDHTIGELLAYDRQHRSDLAETLAVWLETRNMAEAARRLFVHYNTMKNRLERIEAIVGPVLSDAARSLECEVALHIVRHHGLSDGGNPRERLP
jgi:purine catabolism regulator